MSQQSGIWKKEVLFNYLGMVFVLLGLVLLFSLRSDKFFKLSTFTTVANEIPALTVVAVGMTFVLIIAGIDLSVGSVMALCGAVLGVLLKQYAFPLWGAIPLAVITGLLCGLLNGAISVKWSIPSFIVTLGMLEMARGATYYVTNSETIYIGSSVEWIGTPIAGLGLAPAFLIAFVVVIIGQIFLSCSLFGRYMIAVGNNEEALLYSGINPHPVKLSVFAITGLLVGLAAVLHISRLSSATPEAGIGLELQAIAAVVVGGTSLMGGRGSVVRSFLGVLIIAVLARGLDQLGVSEPIKRFITGGVIVLAVIIDTYRHRYSAAFK